MALAGSCASEQATVDEPVVLTSDATPEEEVRDILGRFRDAVRREDVDEIVAHFSEQYSSDEATGTEAVREWWIRVIDTGIAATLDLSLDTAQLRIDGDTAEVEYFDEHGELACPNVETACSTPQRYLDFRLERDDQRGWTITGIPSESQ